MGPKIEILVFELQEKLGLHLKEKFRSQSKGDGLRFSNFFLVLLPRATLNKISMNAKKINFPSREKDRSKIMSSLVHSAHSFSIFSICLSAIAWWFILILTYSFIVRLDLILFDKLRTFVYFSTTWKYHTALPLQNFWWLFAWTDFRWSNKTKLWNETKFTFISSKNQFVWYTPNSGCSSIFRKN